MHCLRKIASLNKERKMSKGSINKEPINDDMFRALLLDDEFINLCQETSEFNIFKVIRSETTELKHSNILAWLFNPYENHNCGNAFIKQFMLSIVSKMNVKEASFNSIYMMDFEDIDVDREWPHEQILTKRKIDILMTFPCIETSGGMKQIVVAIENKIKSGEGRSQLRDYLETLQTKYGKNSIIIPIYLTPTGYEPSIKEWHICSYKEILECIKLVFDQHKEDMSSAKQVFIDHYLKLLSLYINSITYNPELSKICNALYKKYDKVIDKILSNKNSLSVNITGGDVVYHHVYEENKKTFDLINEVNKNKTLQVYNIITKILENDKKLSKIKSYISYIEFVHPVFNEISESLFGTENAIIGGFENRKNYQVTMYLQIQYNLNQELRSKLYQYFKDNTRYNFKAKRTKITDKYSRFHTIKIFTNKDAQGIQEEEKILNTIEDRIKKLFDEKGEFSKIIEFLKDNMVDILKI
jgi:hypothetical protein